MKKKPIRNPFNAIPPPPHSLTHTHTQRNNIHPQHPPPYTHKSPREGVKIHQDVITVGIPRISYKSTLWSENYLFPRILRVSWLHGMFELWDSVAGLICMIQFIRCASEGRKKITVDIFRQVVCRQLYKRGFYPVKPVLTWTKDKLYMVLIHVETGCPASEHKKKKKLP